MTPDELRDHSDPETLPPLLAALWHDARGDWDKAHQIAQDVGSTDGSLVHAYLHRKEGDLSNAAYWYSRANSHQPDKSLEAEWDDLAIVLSKA